MACSMMHHGILSPHRARIRVLRFASGGGNIPLICHACEDAPCIKTCPMNARRRLDNQAVVTDGERCIGCRACAYICPFGAPQVHPDSGKAMPYLIGRGVPRDTVFRKSWDDYRVNGIRLELGQRATAIDP
jgi:Fe-S-cluster-containing hydrogenase component 2